MDQTRGRRTALVRLSAITLAALGGAAITACDRLSPAAKQPSFRGFDLTGADYGRDFSLPDVYGQVRTLADFRGKVVMLFFGFVQCPDICPTALARAAEVKRLLGANGEHLQMIFVTVDPERDTAQVLRDYVTSFDPSFVALRGDAEALQATAAEFKAFYKAVPTGSSYTMDHSTQSYVFDPSGRLRLVLRHDQTAEDYAHDIAQLIPQP